MYGDLPRSRHDLLSEGLSFPDFVDINTAFSAEQLHVFAALRVSEAHEAAQGERDPLHIAAMKALQNYTSATIHRYLPVELLTHILLVSGRASQSMRALRLLHVCRHWRSILLQASGFWADMLATPHVYNKPELVKVLLYRSGSHTFELMPFVPRRDLLYGEMMAPHLHRVSHLHLSLDLIDEELHSLLTSGQFTNLYALRLSCGRYSFGMHFDLIADEDLAIDAALPHLREFAIDAALPRLRELVSPPELLPLLVPQSLEKLRVLSAIHSKSEVASSLRQALSRCSKRLRWLSIAPNAPVLPAKWSPLSDTAPLHFPLLVYLKLSGATTESIKSFLEHVRFSPSTQVFIDYSPPYSYRKRPDVEVEGRLRHLLPEHFTVSAVDGADQVHVRTYAQEVLPVRIEISADIPKYTIQTFQGGRKLLTVRQESIGVAHQIHRAFYGVQSITALRLMLATPQADVPDLLYVLDAFPHLAHLQLGPVDFGPSGNHWITLLNALAGTAPSSGAVVCPSLEELTILKYRRDRNSVEEREGETADVIARTLKERQAQLGRSLLSLVISFIIWQRYPSTTRTHEADEASAALGFYTARLSHFVQNVSVTMFDSNTL